MYSMQKEKEDMTHPEDQALEAAALEYSSFDQGDLDFKDPINANALDQYVGFKAGWQSCKAHLMAAGSVPLEDVKGLIEALADLPCNRTKERCEKCDAIAAFRAKHKDIT
jgi:hypothetical protein